MADSNSLPFDVSRMAIGGLGQMLDSVEFVKRAWSSTLNLPGSLVPTVDIGELDKRIADLKAVEQWLELNLSMLRGTVQALEIQRGTIAAVKAFGVTLGAAQPGTGDTESAAALRRAMAEVAARQSKMASMAPGPAPAPAPAPPPSAAPGPAATPAPDPSATAARPDAKKATSARAARASSAPDPAPAPGLPGINPSAWWNLLQHNFNQVAEAALSGAGLQDAAVHAIKAVTPRAPAAAEPAAAAKSAAAPDQRTGGGAPRKAGVPKRPAAPRQPAAPKAGRARGGA